MITVLPYSPKDQDLAAKLSGWIAELGKNTGHKALVCRDARCNPNLDREIKHNLSQVFDSVDTVDVVERMDSDWSAESNTSARAANIMFRTAAKHIQFTDPQPWLWLEPDVVILKKGWMDEIAKAYNAEPRQPFMGDFVNFPGVPPHMSGIAVYPGVVVDHAPWATMASTQDVAWDVAASGQIVPKMKQIHLIKHQWKFKGVANESELDNLLSQCGDAVIFHQDKSFSVIPLLRQRTGSRSTGAPEQADRLVDSSSSSILDARATSTLPANQNDSTGRTGIRERLSEWASNQIPYVVGNNGETFRNAITDLFIKTCKADASWLEWNRRSIEKFAHGFRQTVVNDSEEGNDGYLWQQVVKMYADTYSDADYICLVDSDTIFTRPVTPETYFKDGKPIWMMTPIDQAHPNESHAWREVMEKFMGKKPEYEWMRRFPFLVPRWAFQAFRDFCKEKHGMELKDYIMAQPYRQFSEFNCLGFYLYEFHRDKFHWVDTSSMPESEWPPLTVDQRWSHGELPKEEWEKILSGTALDAKPPVESSSLAVGVAAQQSTQLLAGGVSSQGGAECVAPSNGADGLCGPTAPPTLSNGDAIEQVKRMFTSPLAKGRIIKKLKAAPILK